MKKLVLLALNLCLVTFGAATAAEQVKISNLPVPTTGSPNIQTGDVVPATRAGKTYGLTANFGATCDSNSWIKGINPTGGGTCARPGFSNMAGTLGLNQGGTGSTTALGARANLELAPIESLVVSGDARDTYYKASLTDSAFGPATPMNRTFGEKFTDEYEVRDWKSASGSPIKCDTVEVYDISSTSGSATFTSTSAYAYNASHIGRQAYVVSYDNTALPSNGGAGIVTASGTVAGGSGNSVTLTGGSANAIRTAAKQYMVIYGNDDTAGLNDLITAASKKGGTLVLPNGTCSVSASLQPQSRVMLAGQSIRSSAIIARPGMTGTVIKSKNYDSLAGQANTNYGSNPLTQAFYGLRNLRIDGASFAQSSPGKCLQLHGNAKYIDSVEVLNCSDGYEGEAMLTFAYSATDPMSREEDYVNNLFIRNYTGKGWRNRGGHDQQIGHVLIYNSIGSTDWGYSQEAGGNGYGGNGYIESLHVYPGPLNINIAAGATRIGNLYNDLGRMQITGGNVQVGTLYMLGCGYLGGSGANPCISLDGSRISVANLSFGWLQGGTTPNMVGISVPGAAEGVMIGNLIGSSTNAAAYPDATTLKFHGKFGSVKGSIHLTNGTGGICADLGGSYNNFDLITYGCTNHFSLDNVSDSDGTAFHNGYDLRAYRVGGEVALTGNMSIADTMLFDGTEQRFVNVPQGTALLPSLTFGGQLTTGLYGGANTVNVAVSAANVGTFNASGLTLPGTLTANAIDIATPLAVAEGGTGGTNAVTAKSNLGLVAIASSGSADDLTSGTVATARLGTGATGGGTKFLADDQTYKTVSGGGSGTVNSGTSGQIAYYAANGTAVSGQSTVPMTAGGNAAGNATQGTANLLRDSTQHARWSAALNGFKSGTAGLTVAMIGDSLIDSVSGGTRLTSISNQLRNGLTHQGLMVNDNAWVGCGDDGNGGVRRDIADVRIVKGSSWGCDNTFLTMGGGTWFSTTNTNALAFTPDIAVDGAIVYYVIQPGAGSFTIDNNGVGLQTINTAGTAAIGTYVYSGGQGSNTTYNLKWSAGGRVDIIGVVATNSSGAAATLINAGVGGSVSAAAVNTTNPWSYLNVMTAIAPGLVIFDYAANDATLAVPTSTYQTNLGTLLTAIQGWNGDAIAMTPPPKNPGSGQSYVFQETYNAIMRTQAATFGIPVADVFNLYESNYTKYQAAPYSLYSDTFVHQSAKGNATISDLLSRIMLSRSDVSKQLKRSVFQEVDSWSTYKLGGGVLVPKNVAGGTSTYFGFSGNAAATGPQNAAFGYQAGNALTTGFNHVAMGYQALLVMNSAQNNTAIGYQALKASTANDNTAVGTLACGVVSTGTNNLCLGRGVGSTTLTTGGSNILIGTSSAITTPAAATNNWLSIGDAIAGSMSAPALSACGTGPALATGGSDLRGTVTTGTGATACTITFATTKANAPTCIVTARSGTPPVYTTSTAALTLTTAAASAGYDFFCSGK